MPTYTDWIQAISATIIMFVTIVYVLKTAAIAKANRKAVEAMREQTEALTRPYVCVTPRMNRELLLFLEITNIGRTAAQDLRFEVSPHFTPLKIKGSFTASVHVFTHTIASFPPGSVLNFPVGTSLKITDSINSDQEQPNVLTITASYKFASSAVTEVTTVDFRMFKGMIQEEMQDKDYLKKISQVLDKRLVKRRR
jgi:uncharacterized membrane protein YcgQ (UPF0703/DUF1980 family)